jgi:outer membrane protein
MRRFILIRFSSVIIVFSVLPAAGTWAQTAKAITQLPSAPPVSLSMQAQAMSLQGSNAAMPAPSPSGVTRLTRTQAEQIALKNNPKISTAQLIALAQHQVVRDARSAEMPTISGDLTAVEANDGSRISAGFLTASRLLEHAGLGVQLNQLITDFGRTHNLVRSSELEEKSHQATAEATREQVVLATDFAFYKALEDQATLDVARQTVNTRQDLADQVSQLTKNNLKSTLDLSFAQVNLSQAKLLLIQAQNDFDSSVASLTAVLGSDQQTRYELVEDTSQLAVLSPDPESFVTLAMQQRPDLQSLELKHEAAQKFTRAQVDQLLPSIRAMGTVGKTPVGSSQYFTTDWYGAVGANLDIPIFNGFHYAAEASEANLQAKAAAERVRDLRNQVARDVRTAWLQANTAYQKVGVTQELLREANLALDLAETRYRLGLSSIVELSQAQLQQTEAAISDANARYQYLFARASLDFQTGTHP